MNSDEHISGFIFDKPPNFHQPFTGKDHPLFHLDKILLPRIHLHRGQTMTVRCHHPDNERFPAFFRLQQDAAQRLAHLIGRHRKRRFSNHLLQDSRLDPVHGRLTRTLHHRVVLRGNSGNPIDRFVTCQNHDISFILDYVDQLSLNFTHHFMQLSCREGDFSFLSNIGLIIRNQTDFTIRCHYGYLFPVCPEEQVAQNRHGGFFLYNPQCLLDPLDKQFSLDIKFHSFSILSTRSTGYILR